MATGGAIAFAAVEYALTLATYVGHSTFASKLRLIALVATLSLVLWLLLALGFAALLVIERIVRVRIAPETACGAGWFVAAPLVRGVRRGVPKLWAAIVAMLVVAVIVDRGALSTILNYKEQQLIAVRIAAIAVAAALLGYLGYRVLVIAITTTAEALAPRIGVANTLGRWRAAGVAVATMIGGGIVASWAALPQSRSVIPVRTIIAAIVVALGVGIGLFVRGHVPKIDARTRAVTGGSVLGIAMAAMVWRADIASALALAIALVLGAAVFGTVARLPRDREHARWVGGATLGLVMATLLWWGADLETRYIAITASEPLRRLIGVVRVANDVDGDGFGSLLGEVDCAPFDRTIHPGAVDTPDDGIDQDCDGEDLKLSDLVVAPGLKMPLPDKFKKDWNVLLITIDDLRYDRTTFGGYAASPAHRDTTPNLAKLVAKSTSFEWCQAPAAGTMASIPAILTSKYFHSGIALDENHNPPKIRPENTTLPEIMKRAGYHTGVIGSHEWWNDWGLDQGVDEYDNSIGKTPDPFRVAADKVTDHILAWISRQQSRKWFMWAHYIDPHGRYVAHPDVVDWGAAETDLYDAEIKWTDQEIGRLFDRMLELPSTAKTIVIITSDHGDSMAEHNVPLGTHGTALNRELLHVPLIIYVPNAPPHKIKGAVTNLDIVPTLAEILDIDVHDLSFEGRSEVPAIFYGRDDHERVVFAETNAPYKQRAAISETWKLIYHLKPNIYELFDLRTDPWEYKNLAPLNPPEFAKLNGQLQRWIARVMHARDPLFNQAFRQMAEVMLHAAPTPHTKTERQTLANDAIEILGVDSNAPLVAGTPADVYVYFHVKQPTQTRYNFAIQVWSADVQSPLTTQTPSNVTTTPARPTADGAFASDQWRADDYIREKFTVQIPKDWHGAVTIALNAIDKVTGRAKATGDAPVNDPYAIVLGRLPLR